jgi:hypothetical protein
MRCHHYCNTIHCWTCILRFYRWAQSHTRGRGESPSFYEIAARREPAPTPESSNGRTWVFEAQDEGSIPSSGTM